MKQQPYSNQTLTNSEVQHRGAQFSLLNRLRPTKQNEEEISEVKHKENPETETERKQQRANNVLKSLLVLSSSKYKRCEKIIDFIKKSDNVFIDNNQTLNLDGTPTSVSVVSFLYNLQQPTKKLSNSDYYKLLEALKLTGEEVINSNAKAAIRKNYPKPVSRPRRKNKKTAKSADNAKRKRTSSKPFATASTSLRTEESDKISDGKEGFQAPVEKRRQEEKREWESYDE